MPGGARLPMAPEDLLEAAVLVYLRGLGHRRTRRACRTAVPSQPGAPLTTRPDLRMLMLLTFTGEVIMPIVAKLDELGKPAWIALMILGFIVFWPIGLVILAFIIGSGRMSCWRHRAVGPWNGGVGAMERGMSGAAVPAPGGSRRARAATTRSTSTVQDTLRRLEEEQREFHEFLDRLRMAKDKAEFDQFMAERRGRSETSPPPSSQN